MLRLVIPLVLALVGAGAGIGAGLMLKPEPELAMAPAPDGAEGEDAAAEEEADDSTNVFVRFGNQFIVPVLEDGRITSLVVLSLSIETTTDGQQFVFQREPKLRDSFLQVLFDHANAGGFSGAFTSGNRLDKLRESLLKVAKRDVGDLAIKVLVTDIARQDT